MWKAMEKSGQIENVSHWLIGLEMNSVCAMLRLTVLGCWCAAGCRAVHQRFARWDCNR